MRVGEAMVEKAIGFGASSTVSPPETLIWQTQFLAKRGAAKRVGQGLAYLVHGRAGRTPNLVETIDGKRLDAVEVDLRVLHKTRVRSSTDLHHCTFVVYRRCDLGDCREGSGRWPTR